MRLSAWTATSTLIARRSSVRKRSPSPITCLNRPMAVSARARVVAGHLLPNHSSAFGDDLKVAVALRGRGRGRAARHRRGARRHNHRRFWMALGDAVVDAVLVVSAVGNERGHRSRNLIKQGADLGAVVDLLGGQQRRDDLACAGVQADMQLPPRPARLGAVLLEQPLARAAQAQARAVHQQVKGLAVSARLRARHLQRRGPAAQGRMVRHAQFQPEQANDGADQALGLAQRQAEHRTQAEGRQDRQ